MSVFSPTSSVCCIVPSGGLSTLRMTEIVFFPHFLLSEPSTLYLLPRFINVLLCNIWNIIFSSIAFIYSPSGIHIFGILWKRLPGLDCGANNLINDYHSSFSQRFLFYASLFLWFKQQAAGMAQGTNHFVFFNIRRQIFDELKPLYLLYFFVFSSVLISWMWVLLTYNTTWYIV